MHSLRLFRCIRPHNALPVPRFVRSMGGSPAPHHDHAHLSAGASAYEAQVPHLFGEAVSKRPPPPPHFTTLFD